MLAPQWLVAAAPRHRPTCGAPLPTLLTALALAGVLLSPAGAAAEPSRAYALVVGVNASTEPGVPVLRYADDDAARYHELFRASAERVVLLASLDSTSQGLYPAAARAARPPTRANLLGALRELAGRLAADRRRGLASELYFIYSGHGHVDAEGEGFVSLQGGRFTRDDLYRLVVEGSGAARVHLIIDACHAQHLVGARGPWRNDRGGTHLDERFKQFLGRKRWQDYRHLGVLLSASAAGETHEWSRLQAGVFSHEVRSGLLGAADANADGVITYAEMRAFLTAANRGVAHARARLRTVVYEPEAGRDTPLWGWPGAGRCRLSLEAGDSGRLSIEDGRGLPYVDLHKESGGRLRIVLLGAGHALPLGAGGAAAPEYWVRRGRELAPLRLPADCAPLRLAALVFKPDETAGRGSADEALRAGLFAVPFGAQFYAGFVAAVPPDPLPLADERPGEGAAPRPARSPRRIAGWTLVGVGAASALSAVILAGLAARDAGTLSDRASSAAVLGPEDRALDARLGRERAAAWALGGVAIAAGVTAAVLLLTGRERRAAVSVGALPLERGGGISVAGTWR